MSYMVRALDLAERAKGWCNPNPAVGAVLVRDGRIVGEGFTQPRGQAHAEIVALEQAGPDAEGATLFVTLEPCAHRGLTGPCTERLAAAGIAEVYCSMLDPSAWVNGRGKAELEHRGIRVTVGEGAEAARRLNQDYLRWVRAGRPFVTAKYAMSLDGKIATHTGSARWVSGEAARALVGRMRSRADAVLVGVDTVLADDPSLTARAADGSLLARQPLRVVLDSRGRLPASARVASGSLPGHTLVATTPSGQAELAGRTLLAALLEQRLIDEVVAFIAPKLVGGRAAPTPLAGRGVEDMAAALDLLDVTYERVGADVLVRGYLQSCSPAS